jgi:hypothetical protein
MIERRLHAVVTVALALGVAYLGSRHYSDADRVQAPAETRRRDQKAGTIAALLTPARAENGDASPNVSVAMLQALSAIGSGEQQPPEAKADAPLARARTTLNERLARGPSNPDQVARLERSVRSLLVPSILGEAVAELRCGGTMCRINLIGEDDARVDRAANALYEHLPKEFSSAVTYPDGTGHRVVYLGTSEGDLKLSSEPAPKLRTVERDAAAAPL